MLVILMIIIVISNDVMIAYYYIYYYIYYLYYFLSCHLRCWRSSGGRWPGRRSLWSLWWLSPLLPSAPGLPPRTEPEDQLSPPQTMLGPPAAPGACLRTGPPAAEPSPARAAPRSPEPGSSRTLWRPRLWCTGLSRNFWTRFQLPCWELNQDFRTQTRSAPVALWILKWKRFGSTSRTSSNQIQPHPQSSAPGLHESRSRTQLRRISRVDSKSRLPMTNPANTTWGFMSFLCVFFLGHYYYFF